MVASTFPTRASPLSSQLPGCADPELCLAVAILGVSKAADDHVHFAAFDGIQRVRSLRTMIKRLPQFAEHHFAALCASAGVVCNGAEQDECGWDFFVQYPAKHQRARPADMQPSGPEALVQIKSTRTRPLVARMKLSNALRAAKASQPFFVVLVVPGSRGLRVYARHFWEAEIAQTLRRVRLAERAGDSRFNKRQFALRMEEMHRHDNDLLEWMRATIEAVKPSYSEEKARIAARVGHEDGFGSMKVTFEGTAEDLLNLQLGLIDALPIVHARYVSQRFGIEAARPDFEVKEGSFSLEPVGKPGRLRLQGGSPTAELFVDAMLYGAELPIGDGAEHRWRVDAGPLRMLGGGEKLSAKLGMRGNDRKRLSDLAVFLTLASWQGAGPVGLQLFLEEKSIPLGSLTFDSGDEGEDRPEWHELRNWNDALQAVVRTAQVAEPEISVLDLDAAAALLARFAGFVASPALRMDYEPLGNGDPTRAAIYYVGCDVGEWCFLAVVERNTRSDEMHGSRRSLTFGPPRLLDAIVRRGCWDDHQAEIEAAYRAQVERLGEPESLWELGELEAFIASLSRKAA